MNKIHFKLKENQEVFFTSDQHLLHKNILQLGSRPFLDMKEMRDGLISNWNSVVKKDDIVFNCGDILWVGNNKYFREFYAELNGFIYTIPGNHDSESLLADMSRQGIINLCSDIVHLWIEYEEKPTIYEAAISHYPLLTWSGRNRGSVNIYGHIHSGPKSTASEGGLPFSSLQYDMGVDNNNYFPIGFREILKKINHPKFTNLITNA